ncbi:MAG: tetratricopeptide repeat protein [Bryobacteraceae bacterium]|nr:tetratricopeptide repeat protein [Bryobacteraceae bacterium]
MMKFLTLTGLLLVSFAACAAASRPDAAPRVEEAFRRLYSFDFPGSEAAARQYIAANRECPLGHGVLAAGYLFSELNRLDALSSPISEQKVKNAKALKPDPAVRAAFWRAAGDADRHAHALLEADPKDRRALAALAISSGLKRDYLALIDKKLRQSMDHIKEAQAWSTRLLTVDPQAHDAYLNTGFSEYLLGNFPFYLRWVVKIEGVEGDKEKGLRQLEIAARSGSLMKPFAQLLLASFYQREGRPSESVRLLSALLAEYPENQVVRRELDKLRQLSD